MDITTIIRKYTTGEKTLEETNKALKEAKSGLRLDPQKNVITDAEKTSFGLLDTGTGSLDKVKIKDGKLVNCNVGDMKAIVIFNGKTYNVKSDGVTLA